jgi:carboxyl-terminal processing protease
LESTANGLTGFGDGQYENYLVPTRPDIDAEAGIWTYQISGASELKLTVREDTLSASGESSLLLQPYLASGKNYNLDTVWQLVQGLYSSNGLNVTIAQTIPINEEQYQIVSNNFFNSETQALVTQGRADSVNIFLVDEVEGGGILGIAAGIPGSLGLQGPHNGVLVSLSSHLAGPFRNQSVNDQLLAETIVHEAGHLLGLWHPTEENGVEFDPLDDTPECSKSVYDSNNNGEVSAEECAGRGAENIMFWTSWYGGNQNQLTDDQRIILKQSPLAFKGQIQVTVVEEQQQDELTLTYPPELSEIVAENAQTVESVREFVELLSECQKSGTSQIIDLILAQGCVNFQGIHYRPAYLPTNLDGLDQVSDYVNVVRQNDRFSYYFEPVTFSENTQALSGGRSYVGFSYQVSDGNALISKGNPFLLGTVFPFTRAWWDGLEVGDRLIAVDGVLISGLTVEEVRDLLPRTEAETTILTLLRDGNQIEIQTASETHLSRSLGSSGQIAYLNLREYTTVSADRVRNDYQNLVSAGVGGNGGVILDLRQNGGGSLSGAWKLTDFLGPSSLDNQVMFSLQQQSQTTDYSFGSYGSDLNITDLDKLVILVDGSSASAAEITSAALKDLGIATLMGGTTYGKGVGQSVVGLLDGSGIYITSFELLSPKGNSWHNVGVIPDYSLNTTLPATPADDTMLQAAIDFLETGSVSQIATSRRSTKSPILLSAPPYTHPWDGGSRQGLQ